MMLLPASFYEVNSDFAKLLNPLVYHIVKTRSYRCNFLYCFVKTLTATNINLEYILKFVYTFGFNFIFLKIKSVLVSKNISYNSTLSFFILKYKIYIPWIIPLPNVFGRMEQIIFWMLIRQLLHESKKSLDEIPPLPGSLPPLTKSRTRYKVWNEPCSGLRRAKCWLDYFCLNLWKKSWGEILHPPWDWLHWTNQCFEGSSEVRKVKCGLDYFCINKKKSWGEILYPPWGWLHWINQCCKAGSVLR